VEGQKKEKFVDAVAASTEDDVKAREADRFKKIMQAQVGLDVDGEVSKEDERSGKEAQKIIRGLAHDRKKKEVPHELIDYTVGLAKREAINTMRYLQFEKQIASYNFRKNIHLSDMELEEMILGNQVALMNQSREFHVMKAWLMFSGYLEDFVAFREIIEAGIQADLAKDRGAAPKAAEAIVKGIADPVIDEIAAERKAKAKEMFK
jgi:hypothetical protein